LSYSRTSTLSARHEPVAGDREVGRGNVEGFAPGLSEQFVQGIRHVVLLVVDDEGKAHAGSFHSARILRACSCNSLGM
jgi:hypothetical protein